MLTDRLRGARFNFTGVALRVASISGKFLLALYLLRYLSLESLGIWGLFGATQTIVLYVVGFEFHAFSNRELLTVSPVRRADVLGSQIRFHLACYLSLLPLSGVALLAGWVAPNFVGWFLLILVGTHLTQEAHRVLIVLSRPRLAYLLTAVAHGVWVAPAIGMGQLWPAARTLDVVFACWAVGSLVSAAIGFLTLRRSGLLQWDHFGTWQDVAKGLRTSFRFLIIALCYRMIELSGRYFLLAFWGEHAVGTYTLFSSIARVQYEILYAGFVALIWPGLTATGDTGGTATFAEHYDRLRRTVLVVTALLIPCFLFGIHPIVDLSRDAGLRAEMTTYYVLVAATSVLGLVTIPHYALYARRMDDVILKGVCGGMFCNLALNLVLVPSLGLLGAAISTLAAFAGILLYEHSVETVVGDRT